MPVLTNDAIVRLKHVTVAGDLQRLLVIRDDHDSLHSRAKAVHRLSWHCTQTMVRTHSDGKLCGGEPGVHIESPQVLVCPPVLRQLNCGPCQLTWCTQHRNFKESIAARTTPDGRFVCGSPPRAAKGAAPECSSSLTSSRSKSVNASAVAPAR